MENAGKNLKLQFYSTFCASYGLEYKIIINIFYVPCD
jgi:hypothetical protein